MMKESELIRYSRQILLPQIGLDGQEKLKNSRVLVVGAGGLGCPALLYLAAAGIGTIGIVDYDLVEESNLHRQILYTTSDIGLPKAKCASKRVSSLNPYIHCTAHTEMLTVANTLEVLHNYDLVIDATDHFSSRYMINDACVLAGKPLIYGAIDRFEGQVAVFNYRNSSGTRSPSYRDLFPVPPKKDATRTCNDAGVLGVLPGIIGTLQASEAIKVFLDSKDVLAGQLFIINVLTMESVKIRIPDRLKSSQAPTTKAQFQEINYQAFCGESEDKDALLQEISVKELRIWMEIKKRFRLLDVREPAEMPEVVELADLHIPLGKIKKEFTKIPRTEPVIVYCKSGLRSASAINQLKDFGFTNLFNLSGGITSWIQNAQITGYDQ